MWNSFCGIKRTKASLLWATCFRLTASARDFCWKPEIQPQKRCKKSKSQTKKQKVTDVHRNAHTQESRTRTGHFSNVSVRQSDLKSTRLRSECLRFDPASSALQVQVIWARPEAPSCSCASAWSCYCCIYQAEVRKHWWGLTPSFFWRSRSSCFSVITAIIIIMVPEPEPLYVAGISHTPAQCWAVSLFWV